MLINRAIQVWGGVIHNEHIWSWVYFTAAVSWYVYWCVCIRIQRHCWVLDFAQYCNLDQDT